MSIVSGAIVNADARTPRVSVIVPTYQRRAALKRLIDALERQTLPPDEYEVVVSIDGSTDGTGEMLAGLSTTFPLQVIYAFPNHGRAAACNRGILASRGEVLVILDDDMEPTPGWLEAHLRQHAEVAARGVLGAVPIRCDASSTAVARYVAAKFDAHLHNIARPGARLDGRAFYSGNFSIRRAVLLEAGLFDESFTEYGHEDVELSLRLRSHGVALVFSPDALASQHYDKSVTAFLDDQIAKGRTAIQLTATRPEAMAASKLASYRHAPRVRLLVLSALLLCSRLVPLMPRLLTVGAAWLERTQQRRLDRLLPFLSDYFFWIGVADAREREAHARARSAAADRAWWRGHSPRAVTVVILLVSVSVAPFIAGYLIAPAGLHFTGAPTYAEDVAQHEAFASEMAAHLRFQNLLTPESTTKGWFFSPLEVALGTAQKVTGLPYMVLGNTISLLCAPLLAFALMTLGRRAGLRHPGKAAILSLVAGSFAPLLAVPAKVGAIPGGFVRAVRSAGGDATPIFAGPGLNLLLALLVLVALPGGAEHDSTRGFRRAGLALAVLAAIYPFFVPTLGLTAVLCALVWARPRGWTRVLTGVGWIVALAALPALYWTALPKIDTEFGRFAALNWRPIYSPQVLVLTLGLGVGAVLGIPRLLRAGAYQQMLACFTIALIIALYVPSHPWRSHLFYLSPVLVIASVAAWEPSFLRLAPRVRRATAGALVAAAAISLPYYYARNVAGAMSFERPAYLTDGDVAAIRWLADQPGPDVVLARSDLSPWVAARGHHRVLVGHYLWTHDYKARRTEVDAAFDVGADPSPFLTAERVKWILLDADRGVPSWANDVEPDFQFGQTVVLRASRVLERSRAHARAAVADR